MRAPGAMVGLRDAHVGLLLCALASSCATVKPEPSFANEREPVLAKCGPDAEPCAAAPYAQTAWSTAHATSRNDDYVPVELAHRYALSWTVLEGFATLMSPSIGPEGHVYITTPSGPDTSTLHAFDRDGRKLWESEAWEGPEGLDSCSGFQTPVVDRQGDIYLSDCNQIWSFSSAGKVRWVVDLPHPRDGAAWQNARAAPVNPLVTAFLTRDGAVGGMSIWGDIVLIESFAPLQLRDTVEGFVATADDGVIYANQGALISTTLQTLAPHFAPLLPDGVALMAPVGGLQVFRPVLPDDGALNR